MTRPIAAVLRGGALGDFVLTLPVVSALVARGFDVRVGTRAAYAPLLPPGARRIDTAWPFHGPGPADVALAVAFSGTAAEALRGAGCVEVRAVEPLPPSGMHARDHYARVLTPPADGAPRVTASPRNDVTDRPVVIAPGSGGAAKRWPIPRWVDVAERLAREGVPVRWVAGPDEEDAGSWPTPPETPDVGGLCTLAAAAGCWLGSDSGPSHLARAVGCATLTVFGPTDPTQWAPVGGELACWDESPASIAARARVLRAR